MPTKYKLWFLLINWTKRVRFHIAIPVTATTNWFVLSEVAGIRDVKFYAESMVEWSALNRPMENVPTSAQFAILKTKKWFNNLVN